MAELSEDEQRNQQTMLATSWTLFSLAFILFMTRLYCRTKILQMWGWDDFFICLALVCASIHSILITCSIHYGLGRHADKLSQYQMVEANKFNWISQGFHVMSTNWGKVSIALFLVRIIQTHKYILYGGIVLLTIINSVCVYTIFGQCTPTTRLWGPSVPGSCWNPNVQRNYAFFQGSFSAFSDLALALYPIYIISKLNMSPKAKTSICCLLSLGIIAMIAGIIKTIKLASLTARDDYTFETTHLVVWIVVEQYLIIIGACIPTTAPLFNISVRKISYNKTYHRSSQHYQNNSTPGANPKSRYLSRGTDKTYHNDHDGPEIDLSAFPDASNTDISMPPSESNRNSGDPIIHSPHAADNSFQIMKTTEISVRNQPAE